MLALLAVALLGWSPNAKAIGQWTYSHSGWCGGGVAPFTDVDSPDTVLATYVAWLNLNCSNSMAPATLSFHVQGPCTIRTSAPDALHAGTSDCHYYVHGVNPVWGLEWTNRDQWVGVTKWCSPTGSTWNNLTRDCECPVDRAWTELVTPARCVRFIDRWHDKPKLPQICYGNPIFPLTGHKRLRVHVGHWLGQDFELIYDTRRLLPADVPGAAFNIPPTPSFGPVWGSNHHKRLVSQSFSPHVVQASRGGGSWTTFRAGASPTVFQGDPDLTDRLTYDYPSNTWRLVDPDAKVMEVYDTGGVLKELWRADGRRLQYTRSMAPGTDAPTSGLLTAVADAFGRQVLLRYEQPLGVGSAPRVREIIDPAGAAAGFAYDAAGNLREVSWAGAVSQSRKFLYELPSLPWALTGELDEANVRHASYGYDPEGRTRSTQLAMGASSFSANYSSPPAWRVETRYELGYDVIWRDHYWVPPVGASVTTPSGAVIGLASISVLGANRLAAQSQPPGAGCAASTRSETYDAKGNTFSRDDFNGHRVCYAHDLDRNLEAVRVEGLPGGAACTPTGAGQPLPVGSRKTSTRWHPDWALRIWVAEPGRRTKFIYNGQRDPESATGPVVTCAPAAATLPDGKPLAVLCRQIEQATTDGDGALGFGAALQAGTASREQRWTYNEHGQVLTHDGPRTDVSDITRYDYYTESEFVGVGADAVGHSRGDLKQVTSAVGHVTQYTLYDKHGQVRETRDPNGVFTRYTYDSRQRLTSVSVAGQTTSHEYWPTGLIKQITLPDASWTFYEHDAAHRLSRVSDSLGNSITYTLDNFGNRVDEQVKDPIGALRRRVSRDIDALGRVQLVSGRE